MSNPDHEGELRRLVEKTTRPDLDEIVELAKKMGVTEAQGLWILFDRIQALWAEGHSFDKSLDW